MIKTIEQAIYNRLLTSDLDTDKEKYLYLYSFVAGIYAGAIHFVMLIFFFFIDVMCFRLINVGSVITYVMVCLIVTRKHYFAGQIITAIEVTIYTCVSTILIGLDSYSILYMVLIMMLQIMVPYASKSVRISVGACIWILQTLIVVVALNREPIINLGSNQVFISLFNIEITMMGTIAVLCTATLINSVIENYNKQMLERYRVAANTDPLTGLYNRRGASVLSENMKAVNEQWYVAIMDIDDFKMVNDRYGHDVGDDVLRTVANIMQQEIRKTDVLFRWGGEEFLICLKEVSESEAFVILEKIRRSVERTGIAYEGGSISVTITMGASLLDTDNMEQSIKRSDELLYYGKQHGKNQVVMSISE